MKTKRLDTNRFSLEASKAELQLLNNALNEICNGVRIEDPEFATRLGASRAEARRLLESINGALQSSGGAPA